jgi:hypothetical protein
MNNEFKKINNNNTTRYVLEDGSSGGATSGGTSAGSISSFEKPMGGIQRRAGDDLIHQENKKSYKVSHKPKNPVAKAHQTVGTGSGAHKDKTKVLPRQEKHKKSADMTMENFNAEYDDEAGMAYGSLHTLKRAVDGLMNTIDNKDNLPEWCQEKISLAEDYLVTVWDYLQSEKEQGLAEGWKEMKATELGEKITVVNDPEKATGVQTTGGITSGSVYAGKPAPQSLRQKLQPANTSNPNRAMDAKGRTRQQWIQAVKQKFPDAKVMVSKMIDGPCFAMLADGRKLSWNKVEQGATETTLDDTTKCKTCGTPYKQHFRFDDNGKILSSLVRHPTMKDDFPGMDGMQRVTNQGADSYMESLAATLAEKLDPNAEPEVWVQDFQKANPNKYHQFKNKTPQKKAQMAVAARRDARLKK